jgi:SPP1 gp7 family putative phage head morphogenesis protein
LETPLDDWLEFQTTEYITRPSEPIIQRNMHLSYIRGKNGARNKLLPLEVAEGMTPLDWIALEEIQHINYNRITDCTNSMKNAINYSCSRGVMEGWGAQKIAYELRNNISGNQNMGIKRCKMIARTEVINAYNVAARKTYESAGLKKKEMIWITSFDERTCPICSGYDGMSMDRVGEFPPVHPNCRCSIYPKVET